MDRYARELEGLLSQRRDDDGPVDDLVRAVASQKAPLVLYGAGSMGGPFWVGCEDAASNRSRSPMKRSRSRAGISTVCRSSAFRNRWRAMATLFSPSQF